MYLLAATLKYIERREYIECHNKLLF